MKKYVLIGVLIVCAIGSVGYFLLMNNDIETTNSKVSQSSEKTLDTQISTESSSQTETTKEETKKTSKSDIDWDAVYLVKDFTKKFTNFSDVYERNQAIKPFVTEQFAKDNSLDVDPHVEYESSSHIDSISQDTSNNKLYVVIGTEESKGYSNGFCLQVELTNDKTQISNYVMQYVRGY